MSNKKFRKNERAIFVAYYKLRECPIAKRVAKQANISRSTLYRHHRTTFSIPHDYEKYLLRTYSRQMYSFLHEKGTSLSILFLRTLVFISNNKDIFEALFRDGHKEVIRGILDIIRPKIVEEWQLFNDDDVIYHVYSNEVLGIIEVWSKYGFSDKYLSLAQKDIIFLTKTARKKLLPLASHSSPKVVLADQELS